MVGQHDRNLQESFKIDNTLVSPGTDPLLLYLVLIIKLYGDTHSLNNAILNLRYNHLPKEEANWEYIIKRLLVVYSITEHTYLKHLEKYIVNVEELETDIIFDITFFGDTQWEIRNFTIKRLGAPVASLNEHYIIPLLKKTISKISNL